MASNTGPWGDGFGISSSVAPSSSCVFASAKNVSRGLIHPKDRYNLHVHSLGQYHCVSGWCCCASFLFGCGGCGLEHLPLRISTVLTHGPLPLPCLTMPVCAVCYVQALRLQRHAVRVRAQVQLGSHNVANARRADAAARPIQEQGCFTGLPCGRETANRDEAPR